MWRPPPAGRRRCELWACVDVKVKPETDVSAVVRAGAGARPSELRLSKSEFAKQHLRDAATGRRRRISHAQLLPEPVAAPVVDGRLADGLSIQCCGPVVDRPKETAAAREPGDCCLRACK
jgi:hypothetical protein